MDVTNTRNENQSDPKSGPRRRASRTEWVLSILSLGCLVLAVTGIAGDLSLALFALGLAFGMVVVYMTCGRLRLRIAAELSFLIVIPVIAILAAVLFPLFADIRSKTYESQCHRNLSVVHSCMTMYADGYDGKLPPAEQWSDVMFRTLPDYMDRSVEEASALLRCPAAGSGIDPSYALNGRVGGMRLKDIGKDTVLLFECIPGRNRSGGPELLPRGDMHPSGINVLFADGSVKTVHHTQVGKLRWRP